MPASTCTLEANLREASGVNSMGALSSCAALAAKTRPSGKDIILYDAVGSGSTATVFQGTWKGFKVAVKRVSDPDTWNVQHEIDILSRASHPNLIEFIGAALINNSVCVLTDFCSGPALFDVLHNSDVELELPQQQKMCLDIASGMNSLHIASPKIIHMDLKSLNVLLVHPLTDGKQVPQLKICDFGSAVFHTDDRIEAETLCRRGTPNWKAPELFACRAFDEKVDVYSYAIVLLEIFCYEIAFEDETADEISVLVTSGVRPDFDVLSLIPAGIQDLAAACWDAEPASRPSFGQVLQSDALRMQPVRCSL